MILFPESLSIQERYKLLTGLVVPRPIAWVSTKSIEGINNIAPFSYYSIVGHMPMTVSFSVAGRKPDAASKDTLRNAQLIEQGGLGEFVVNVVDDAHAAAMAKTAVPLPFGASEFDFADIPTAPCERVAALRVATVPAAFECKTTHVLEVGVSRLVIGEVVALHIQERVLDPASRVRFDQLNAIGRLAGGYYSHIDKPFEIEDASFFPSTSTGGKK